MNPREKSLTVQDDFIRFVTRIEEGPFGRKAGHVVDAPNVLQVRTIMEYEAGIYQEQKTDLTNRFCTNENGKFLVTSWIRYNTIYYTCITPPPHGYDMNCTLNYIYFMYIIYMILYDMYSTSGVGLHFDSKKTEFLDRSSKTIDINTVFFGS